MAYNVISCRKVAENTLILKIAKFAMKIWLLTLEITKNISPKNDAHNCNLLKVISDLGPIPVYASELTMRLRIMRFYADMCICGCDFLQMGQFVEYYIKTLPQIRLISHN